MKGNLVHAFCLTPLSYLNPRVCFFFKEIVYIVNTGSDFFIMSFLLHCLSEQLKLIPQLRYWTRVGLIKIFILFLVCCSLLAFFITVNDVVKNSLVCKFVLTSASFHTSGCLLSRVVMNSNVFLWKTVMKVMWRVGWKKVIPEAGRGKMPLEQFRPSIRA